MDMKDKLRIILPHWLDHNREHGLEFKRWADDLADAGESDLADKLQQIFSMSEDIVVAMEQLLENAGGPLEHPDMEAGGHHHHHHHEHK